MNKPMKTISRESVENARRKKPKRLQFGAYQQLKKTPKLECFGTLNVPFGDGFKRLFPFDLFPVSDTKYTPDALWRAIDSEAEFEEINEWVKKQGKRIFLRDCLYTSVAMDYNFLSTEKNSNRTSLGELEYQAKTKRSMNAVESLAKHCVDTITGVSLYESADLVCSVPSAREFNLPSEVVSRVSKKIAKENITNQFTIANPPSIKSTRVDEKWDRWEESSVNFGGNVTGKKIILIDDKYQSGTTIQYIAMKLQEAGAHSVLGLCMVKTMNDSDNQP